MVYSLNRGLWAGLAVSVAWVVARRLVAGDVRALVAAALGITALVADRLVATPLGTHHRQTG